jgi:hypothetical protein
MDSESLQSVSAEVWLLFSHESEQNSSPHEFPIKLRLVSHDVMNGAGDGAIAWPRTIAPDRPMPYPAAVFIRKEPAR